jgi:hypothetical protein
MLSLLSRTALQMRKIMPGILRYAIERREKEAE